MRRAVAITVLTGTAALGGAAFAVPSGAASSGCATTMTFSGPRSLSKVLEVDPAAPSIKAGSCVAFKNATSPSEQVSITITKGGRTVFTTTLTRGATTDVHHGFAPDSAGSYTVSAVAAEPLGLNATGGATITVKPAPSGSPSPTNTPKAHHSRRPVSLPTVSPTKSRKRTPKPHATGIKLPPLPPLPKNALTAPNPKGSDPVVAPGPATAPPVTESATPVAAIYNGPIEPADDDSRGLPIAIGVLVFLGVASGWGRALLATATGSVDKRSKGQHRS